MEGNEEGRERGKEIGEWTERKQGESLRDKREHEIIKYNLFDRFVCFLQQTIKIKFQYRIPISIYMSDDIYKIDYYRLQYLHKGQTNPNGSKIFQKVEINTSMSKQIQKY